MKNKNKIQTSKKKKKSTLNIVDPFMGSGAILDLFNVEKNFLKDIGLIEVNSIKFVGIEIDSVFFNNAKSYLNQKITSEELLLLNSTFDSVVIKNYLPDLADVIITQPPYGYSIEYSDTDISKLYSTLFKWSENNLEKEGILALITPRKEYLPLYIDTQDLNKLEFQLIEKLDIKQHSLHVGIYIFKKR